MLLRESNKTCLMVLANRADFLTRMKDGDKDYKSMLPCYYVEKIDEVKECSYQSFTLKIMQTSVMKAGFQIAECSLSSAKTIQE